MRIRILAILRLSFNRHKTSSDARAGLFRAESGAVVVLDESEPGGSKWESMANSVLLAEKELDVGSVGSGHSRGVDRDAGEGRVGVAMLASGLR